MKLNLIRYVSRSDRESWRWLAMFEILEGGTAQSPDDYEEWEKEVFAAAEACGVTIRPEGNGGPGQAFAHAPVVDVWTHSAPIMRGASQAMENWPHLTIEQTGGLDV